MPVLGEAAALAGAVLWGFTTVLVRSEARRIDVLFHNAVRTSVSACTLVLVVLALWALGIHVPTFGPRPWLGVGLLTLSIALTVGAGDSLYFTSMQWIGVARAMPISMSYPLLTSLLAVALLGERISVGLIGGLVLIPCGLLLVTLPAGRVVTPRADLHGMRLGIAMAFGASIFWAVALVIVRPALDQVDVLSASSIRAAAGAASVWVVAWRTGRLGARAKLTRARFGMALLGGSVPAFGGLLSLVAIQQAGVARQATLAATAPLYAIPLSVYVLGEQLTRRVAIGSVITVIGVGLVVGL